MVHETRQADLFGVADRPQSEAVAHITGYSPLDLPYVDGPPPAVDGPYSDPRVAVDNPKKAMGDLKPSAHFVPMGPIFKYVTRVMEGGAKKYGVKNWRKQPIRASTYYSAALRHLSSWFEEGEWLDPESGQPHLAHAICCCLLVLDSQYRGILDRKSTRLNSSHVSESRMPSSA